MTKFMFRTPAAAVCHGFGEEEYGYITKALPHVRKIHIFLPDAKKLKETDLSLLEKLAKTCETAVNCNGRQKNCSLFTTGERKTGASCAAR